MFELPLPRPALGFEVRSGDSRTFDSVLRSSPRRSGGPRGDGADGLQESTAFTVRME